MTDQVLFLTGVVVFSLMAPSTDLDDQRILRYEAEERKIGKTEIACGFFDLGNAIIGLFAI